MVKKTNVHFARRTHTGSRRTFSAISWEWCSECSLSRNMRCCSLLASLQVSQVDSVQLLIPRHARDMMARWSERMASCRFSSARTNWKFRIPPIKPQIQQEENAIIWKTERYVVGVCLGKKYYKQGLCNTAGDRNEITWSAHRKM